MNGPLGKKGERERRVWKELKTVVASRTRFGTLFDESIRKVSLVMALVGKGL